MLYEVHEVYCLMALETHPRPQLFSITVLCFYYCTEHKDSSGVYTHPLPLCTVSIPEQRWHVTTVQLRSISELSKCG